MMLADIAGIAGLEGVPQAEEDTDVGFLPKKQPVSDMVEVLLVRGTHNEAHLVKLHSGIEYVPGILEIGFQTSLVGTGLPSLVYGYLYDGVLFNISIWYVLSDAIMRQAVKSKFRQTI